MSKTKRVQYFDANLGCVVDKDITIPPRVKVKSFPSGMTVEEIPPSMLGDSNVAMLGVPLVVESRNALQKELLKASPSFLHLYIEGLLAAYLRKHQRRDGFISAEILLLVV
jgi:hypothetical protein